MDWRAKVELFEKIRREYEVGVGTIQGVARKLGVHRRMVRDAIWNAVPAQRKKIDREPTRLVVGRSLSRFDGRGLRRSSASAVCLKRTLIAGCAIVG